MDDKTVQILQERYSIDNASASSNTDEFALRIVLTSKIEEKLENDLIDSFEDTLGKISSFTFEDLNDTYEIYIHYRNAGDRSRETEQNLELPPEILNERDINKIQTEITNFINETLTVDYELVLILNSKSYNVIAITSNDCFLVVSLNENKKNRRPNPQAFKKRIVIIKANFSSQAELYRNIRPFLREYLQWQVNRNIAKFEKYPQFLERKFEPFSKFLQAEGNSLRDNRFKPKAEYIDLEFPKSKRTKKLNPEDNLKNDENLDDAENETDAYLRFDEVIPRQLQETGNFIDLCWTETKDPGKKKEQKITIKIENWDEDGLVLIFSDRKSLRDLRKAPSKGIIILNENLTNHYRKSEALEMLKKPFMTPLQNLVDMMLRPEVFSPITIKKIFPYNNRIRLDNEETKCQYLALQKIFSSPDLSVVQGPPGSGKTTLIVELIKQCVSRGLRVLMCAPTHVAVDNIIERLNKEQKFRLQMVRIGRAEKVDEDLQKYMLNNLERDWSNFMFTSNNQLSAESSQNVNGITLMNLNQQARDAFLSERKTLKEMIINTCNLVCGTSTGVVSIYGRNNYINEFDVMIIDESSKATILEFLIPATRAKKWVIIGDQNQLPPYIDDREVRIFLLSYFEKKFEEIDDGEELQKKMNEYAKQKMTDWNQKSKKDLLVTEDYRECTDIKVPPFLKYLMTKFRDIYEGTHFLTKNKSYIEREKQQIRECFQGNRKIINLFNEIIHILGSCYHYFYDSIEDSRHAMLDYQYRMPPILGDFISQSFYTERGQKLKNAEITKTHGLRINKELFGQDSEFPLFSFISTSTFPEQLRNETQKPNKTSYSNKLESLVCIKILEQILSTIKNSEINNLWSHPDRDKDVLKDFDDKNPLTIGVITFYAAQFRQIKDFLKGHPEIYRPKKETADNTNRYEDYYIFKGFNVRIQISIVDRFQGQEKDIIIIPLTRSNSEMQYGFLKSRQRLNVAFSRAKHNLFVVGNYEFFSSLDKKEKNEIEIFQKLVKYVNDHHLRFDCPQNKNWIAQLQTIDEKANKNKQKWIKK